MIELLGLGVPRDGGGWLLQRVCARIAPPCLVVVTSVDVAERRALLDAVTGRRVPDEGRAWLDGVPVMRATMGRVRELVADTDPSAPQVAHRSALWNTLAGPGLRLADRLLRFPRRDERAAALRALSSLGLGAHAHVPVGDLDAGQRALVAIAGGLARGARCLVVRELDRLAAPAEVAAALSTLARVVRGHRLVALVGLRGIAPWAQAADRVLALADGLLIFDGAPGRLLNGDRGAARYPAPDTAPARA